MLHIITACTASPRMKYITNSTKGAITILDIPNWKCAADKIYAVTEYIQHLPEDDIVCFIDAYDSILYANPEEIKDRFLAYDTSILFSAETSVYPRTYETMYNDLHKETNPTGTSPYRFLHSGGYIGYVHSLRAMFAWRDPTEIWAICSWGGDQNFYTEYYLTYARYAAIVKLDSENQVFHAAFRANTTGAEINADGRFVLDEITTPCLVHYHGFSMADMESIANAAPEITTPLCDVLPPSIV